MTGALDYDSAAQVVMVGGHAMDRVMGGWGLKGARMGDSDSVCRATRNAESGLRGMRVATPAAESSFSL